jgi:hypothetical protein
MDRKVDRTKALSANVCGADSCVSWIRVLAGLSEAKSSLRRPILRNTEIGSNRKGNALDRDRIGSRRVNNRPLGTAILLRSKT